MNLSKRINIILKYSVKFHYQSLTKYLSTYTPSYMKMPNNMKYPDVRRDMSIVDEFHGVKVNLKTSNLID